MSELTFTATAVRYFDHVVGYRPSATEPNLWFVASLDARGDWTQYLGQVEYTTPEAEYSAYEYPTAEAAAEGASDVSIGAADSLDEALELFAASWE
jgi:hypothetical protein